MKATKCLDYLFNNLVCLWCKWGWSGSEIKQYRDFVVSVTVIGLVKMCMTTAIKHYFNGRNLLGSFGKESSN